MLALSVSSAVRLQLSEPASDSDLRAEGSPCESGKDCVIVQIDSQGDSNGIPTSGDAVIKVHRFYSNNGGDVFAGFPDFFNQNYEFTVPMDKFETSDGTSSFLISGNYIPANALMACEPIQISVTLPGGDEMFKTLPTQPCTLMFLSDAQTCVDSASRCIWNGDSFPDTYERHQQDGTTMDLNSNRRGRNTKYLAWQITKAAFAKAFEEDSTDQAQAFEITFWNRLLSASKDGSADNYYNFTIPASDFPEFVENAASRRNFAVAIEGFKNDDLDIAISNAVVRTVYQTSDMDSFEGRSVGASSLDDLVSTASLQDPHLVLADGGMADFRGSHNGIYNMLSSRAVSVNALFREQDFYLSHDDIEFVEHGAAQGDKFLVHGTFMFELYASIRTSSGRLLQLRSVATPTSVANLAFLENGVPVSTMSAGETRVIDDVTIVLDEKSATISTPSWEVACVTVRTETSHFMNLKLSQRAVESVAPHGVIGQSYDGDGIAVDGAQDKYSITPGAETVTSAQAEGAIEGVHTDYLVDAPFTTEYKFARFGRKAAAPREVKDLFGKKLAKRDRRKLSYMLERLVGAKNVAAAN